MIGLIGRKVGMRLASSQKTVFQRLLPLSKSKPTARTQVKP